MGQPHVLHGKVREPQPLYQGLRLLLSFPRRGNQAGPGGHRVPVLDGVGLIEGADGVLRQDRVVAEHDNGLFAVKAALAVGARGIGPDLEGLLPVRALHQEGAGSLGVVLSRLPPGELHLGGRGPRLVPGGEIPLLQLFQLAFPMLDLVLLLAGRAVVAGEPVVDELLHLCYLFFQGRLGLQLLRRIQGVPLRQHVEEGLGALVVEVPGGHFQDGEGTLGPDYFSVHHHMEGL